MFLGSLLPIMACIAVGRDPAHLCSQVQAGRHCRAAASRSARGSGACSGGFLRVISERYRTGRRLASQRPLLELYTSDSRDSH